jgi:hypothetical protein
LPLFAALSLSLHATVVTVLGRSGAPSSPPAFDAHSLALAGDTLDVEPPPEVAAADEVQDPSAIATAAGIANSTARLAPSPTGVPRARPGRAFGSEAAAAAPPHVYGALGVRFASDLATTFTRAFPQAASAEKVWSSVPFGAAGWAELTLVLDDEGHLANSAIAGAPSAALRRSIERTLVLLAPRSFTAGGAITKLRISAHVSRNDVHDGLHGDVFALSAGSFSGDVGAAFFALPPAGRPGRRVDVEVRLLR